MSSTEGAGRPFTPGPDAHSLLTVLRKTCFQPLFPELTEASGFEPAKPLAARDCSVFKNQQTPPQDAKSYPFPTTRNQVYPQGYRGFESHPLRQLRNSRHRSVSRPQGGKLRYGGDSFAFGRFREHICRGTFLPMPESLWNAPSVDAKQRSFFVEKGDKRRIG